MIAGLVSTVIPVHNRPDGLREAVASVLVQDGVALEIVIVDDGSTDETAGWARSLASQDPHRIRTLHRANGGPGAAREMGRLAARGEFIQYLDSDDVLLPGKFGAQVAALRADPQAVAAYGITHLRDASGALVPGAHKRTGERIAAMFPAFLESRWWETATPLYRASVTDAAGPWSAARLEEDWEYDCRIASLGGRLAYVPQAVSEHRDHAGQRLSRGEPLDPARLRDRAAMHERIHGHARRAGIACDVPEMRHFARALFLLARQCGAAGLAEESKRLFALSREASGEVRARGADYRVYGSVASLVGWTAAGKASAWLDRMRG